MAGSFKGSTDLAGISTGSAFEDGHCTLGQLFVFRHDIHHEVAIHKAQPAHRSRGNHVENHLVSGCRFHARRSGEDFWAHLGDDREMCGALERRIRIAGECNGASTAVPCCFNGGECKRCAAARSDAEHNIVLPRFPARHFIAALFGVVLADFGVRRESFGTSGDNELHAIGVERRRTLGSIEGSDATAGSRSDIDQPAAVAQGGRHPIDGPCNLWQRARDRSGHGSVFSIDQTSNLQGGSAVEVPCCIVGLFGAKPAKV